MRNLVAVALTLLLSAATVFAQDALNKGTWGLGGNVSFTSSSGDLYENSDREGQLTLTMSPNVWYFFMDHLSVGALLFLNSSQQGNSKSNVIMFGPGAQYYLSKMGPGNPYGELAYVFGSSSSKNGDEYKFSSSQLQLSIGYLIWLNEHVVLDLKLGYSIDRQKQTKPVEVDAIKGSKIGFSVGFDVFNF